jgi:hypothetical protein
MGKLWSDIVDGTATGPTVYVPMHDGDAVVQAFWDDERGVQVTYEVDCAMTREEVLALRDAVDSLLASPAPSQSPV